MSNDSLRSEIATLERKVKLLLSEHSKLKEDMSVYRKEKEELSRLLRDREQALSSFQNKDKITKIVDNMVGSEDDKTELKEVLNSYIKEIDKCIAHLGEV